MSGESLVSMLRKLISESRQGSWISVYVVPGSDESRLEYRDGEFLFYSSASCKDHGVNMDLLRWFYRATGVRPRIARGWSSRRKILVFQGLGRGELAEKLAQAVRVAGRG